MKKYECLKLKNQLCFPLYAASNAVIRKYKPFLDKLDLTYTQYLAMMVIWEKKFISVKTLGECLFLDSGTLTPLLKKLEVKGYIERDRFEEDERMVVVSLTEKGEKLKEKAVDIPKEMAKELNLEPKEITELHEILYKILER